MRLDLTANLFSSGVQDHLRRELFGFACEGRHVVSVSECDREFALWRDAQNTQVQEELDFAVEFSIEREALDPHPFVVVIEGQRDDDWTTAPPRLSAKTARDVARLPVRVLVEDVESDQAFLFAAAPPSLRDRLRELLDKRWLELVHGGGSRIGNVMRDSRRQHDGGRRTFVLFDSDALEPGVPAATAVRLGEHCERLGLRFHRLERRESENYLPPEALRRWAMAEWRTRGNLFQAWIRLRASQRHHFDVKRGLGERERALQLFSDVTDEDRRTLSNYRFGERIWREFRDLDERWVQRDGQLPELSQICSAILGLR